MSFFIQNIRVLRNILLVLSNILFVLSCASSDTASSDTGDINVSLLPFFSVEDLVYQGAFRIPADTFGESTSNYSEGIFTYNPDNNSIFLVGHVRSEAIAEFSLPNLVLSTNSISELNLAKNIQPYSIILNRIQNGNPENIDRISGLYYKQGKVFINAATFYDAAADNVDTTVIIENASDITQSVISGFYELEGAVHSAGWISEIPDPYKIHLGGNYITGHADNYAINSRNSMGPTAFVLNLSNIYNTETIIPTEPLIDFSLSNYLNIKELDTAGDWQTWGTNVSAIASGDYKIPDLDVDGNVITRGNNLWTEKSNAHYGFLVPGSRTYAVFGSSGGHNSGIGYKITQSDGNICGGFCSYDADDNYNYYWLWDVMDLIDVKNGIKQPHEVTPYDYGELKLPFQVNGFSGEQQLNKVGGGYYDSNEKFLYLSLKFAGQTGHYDRPPIILKYKINIH